MEFQVNKYPKLDMFHMMQGMQEVKIIKGQMILQTK